MNSQKDTSRFWLEIGLIGAGAALIVGELPIDSWWIKLTLTVVIIIGIGMAVDGIRGLLAKRESVRREVD